MAKEALLVPDDEIGRRIFLIRGRRVMLDRDLAEIYGVSTKRLNEQVKRNRRRFPEDFMFRLTFAEARDLAASRSQSATLKKKGQNIKYRPHAFTEHGVVMLASVLNTRVAVAGSLHVVRAFVHLRQLISAQGDLAQRLRRLEKESLEHGSNIRTLFEVVESLILPPERPRHRIGFKPKSE